MKGKDVKGKGKGSGGVCHECSTCKSFGWIYPVILLLIALVPGLLAATWAKWTIVIVAVLMLTKRLKPCKMCSQM